MWGSLLVIKLYVGESSGYKVICGWSLLVIKLYVWGSLLVIKLYVGESSGYKVICGGVFWL